MKTAHALPVSPAPGGGPPGAPHRGHGGPRALAPVSQLRELVAALACALIPQPYPETEADHAIQEAKRLRTQFLRELLRGE
jgi:hypothetical protein